MQLRKPKPELIYVGFEVLTAAASYSPVTRQLPIATARIWSQVRLCGICGEKMALGLKISVSLANPHSSYRPTSINHHITQSYVVSILTASLNNQC
jgi:hypothetical protein